MIDAALKIYLCIGLLLGLGALCIEHTSMTDYEKKVRDIIYPNRSLWVRFKDALTIPFAILLIILGWPYIAYMIFEGFQWGKLFQKEKP